MEGRQLVRVEFDYPHEVPSHPKQTEPLFVGPQSGWLLLDPRHYWCIARCELRYKEVNGWMTTTSITNEWRDGRRGAPVPTRERRVERRPAEANLDGETIIEFDLQEADPLPPDEEFTLSAFGLPEPSGMEVAKPSRWYLWFMLAGGASIALALGFRKLGQRWKSA